MNGMGKWPGPVFDAVEAAARRRRDETVYTGAALCHRARKHAGEIQRFRVYRQQMREIATREPTRNGAVALLDMHPIEAEAIVFLCPDFMAPNAQRQKDGLRWVKKQPWAEEFLPPPFEQRRY